jgi:short subunit fatty acids transporter
MRTPERRHPRTWTPDPFLFTLALTFLGFVTVVLAVTGRLRDEPALLVLAVVSVVPAFWLFYQRAQALAPRAPRAPRGRRRR